jgi:hypothetical protein
MKTNFFRKSHSSSKGGMRIMRLALLLLPLLGRGLGGDSMLFAQNGVTVSNLAVSAGSPSTVTFNVSWDREAMQATPWSDTVWVWADYNNAGTMTRLPLVTSGATLTETSAPGTGEVIPMSGNNQGVWVAGNARDAGAFSATVQLLVAVTDINGGCAYASNYPPAGNYTAANKIEFTGTPQYTIVLKKDADGTTEVLTEDSPYEVPDGYMVQSFTDKTGAPGRLGCIPMTGNIDFLPIDASKGFGVSFAVTQHPTLPGAAAITYTWSASDFTPSSGTGTFYAPTAPANTGTYPVALTARSEGYCDLEVSKTVTVIECVPSSIYTLTASATAYCAGSTVTFALSNTTSGRTYWLYKGTEHVNTLTAIGGAATFTGAFAGAGVYTAQVIAEGGNCVAVMNGTHTITETPPSPDYTTNDGACTGSCNLAYVQLRNGCSGAVTNSQYRTYTNTGCTTPYRTDNNGACSSDCGYRWQRLLDCRGSVILAQYTTVPDASCKTGCPSCSSKSSWISGVTGESNAVRTARCTSWCTSQGCALNYMSCGAGDRCECYCKD